MLRRIGFLSAAVLLTTVWQTPPRCAAQRPETQNPRRTALQQAPRRAPAGPVRRGPIQGPPTAGRGGVRTPHAPAPPFVLSPAQERELDVVLHAWEERSKSIKTLNAKFKKWEHSDIFPDQNTEPMLGELYFAAPDKGAYKVDGPQPEHWVCDGKSIYEYNYEKKQVIERPLPEHLQGKAIADGPLPFLFGADVAKLKTRYYMRVTTPPDHQKEEIWIEAVPRHHEDLVNFSRADLVLKRQDMLPHAIRIHEPNGKGHTVHVLYEKKINSPLDKIRKFFISNAPLGWKKVIEELPPVVVVPEGPSRIPQGREQSRRPAGVPRR